MISCPKCAFKEHPSYADEWFKRVHGIAKKDMLCDWCNTPIKKGNRCAAESMGRHNSPAPYYRWEDNYIHRVEKICP